jgi:branched-chain amino acid aminotransferase
MTESKYLARLDASKLQTTLTKKPTEPHDPTTLKFGKHFTGLSHLLLFLNKQNTSSPHAVISGNWLTYHSDHMLLIKWSINSGWSIPEIVPYQQIPLDPSCGTLNYAISCFEGMKAYVSAHSKFLLFRPLENLRRMCASAERLALPTFDADELLKCIASLVELDMHILCGKGGRKGCSLYLRPNLIGTSPGLGVGPPTSALLYVIASPVGEYFPSDCSSGISLLASSDLGATRAFYGGAGNLKVAANYAPTIVPQLQAERLGCQQVLWVMEPDCRVTEAGTTNLFVVLKSKDGGACLITPPTDGVILPGVIRDSVLSLAREKLEPLGWGIEERAVTMAELRDAADNGSLIEMFGTGTAAVVVPVKEIVWGERAVRCKAGDNLGMGEIAGLMKNWIEKRQYGEEEHEWGVETSSILGSVSCKNGYH